MIVFRFMLLTVFLIFIHIVNAQDQLLIQKPGKTNRIILTAGTEIQFRLKDDHHTYRREIIAFRDSGIVFRSFEIPLDEIGMIRIPLHPRLKTYSEVFIAGGTILFVADQINNSIIDDNDWSLSKGVTITSLSMISAGVLIRFLQKRTYRFPGKHKLKII